MNGDKIISFYGLSDKGRQRTNNEDAFVAEQLDQDTILAVAIDGVGGYEGGEVAAAIAQLEIPKYLKNFRNGEKLELLKQAVVYANNAIFDRRETDAERSNMSCVLTSAIVDCKRKVIDMVHVGDTRLYQYHNGVLSKLSHDHSLVGYREEVGDLTEEQAMHHPQRNVISRDVGSAKHEIADRDFLEAEEFPLLPNSIILLCSDGLTDLITSSQIIAILSQKGTLESKTQALIDAANTAGGKDNITAVLVDYQADEEETLPKQHQMETKTNKKEKETSTNELSNQTDIMSINIRNLNLWILVVAVAALLMSCVALFCTFKTRQQLNDLQSQFENHLLYSDFYNNEIVQEDSVNVINAIIIHGDSTNNAVKP